MDTVLTVRCVGVGPRGPFALASWALPDDNLSLMQRYPWWVNPSYANSQKWKPPRRIFRWAFSGAPSQAATTRVVAEALRNVSFLVVLLPGMMIVYLTAFMWDSPGAGEIPWVRAWTNWITSLPIFWVACVAGSALALHVAGWDRGRCPRTLRRLAMYLILLPYVHALISFALAARLL